MPIPYPTEHVAEVLGLSPVELVERFGEVVLIDYRHGAIELRPGPPSAAEMRRRVAAIIDAARPALRT
jgi:hypothetical protein